MQAYDPDERLLLRPMAPDDADAIYQAFFAQGWHPDRETYRGYYARQQSGALTVVVAEYDGGLAGYVTLKPRATAGPFAGKYPELCDFNVFEPYRNRGIGNRILDIAEGLAFADSPRVTLGVGLHSGYGAAQRIYIRRGYLPDGSGAWYRDRPLAQYAPCSNDDSLVLYLYKERG
ncbi:MAG: GNAT family N-acetyltransferase [Eubacteriales bacterium]|nr:GNAT family N-acetyltransferase [Eubacteriales bacterium]